MRPAKSTTLALMFTLATVAAAGCQPSTYVIVEDLPSPPAQLGGRVPGEMPESALRPPARTIEPAGPTATEPARPARPVVPVEWIPSGREQRWRHIVIHHSATDQGSAACFDRFHREMKGFEEMGYHFVITNGQGGPDGAVEVGSRWRKQKWGAHCGGTPDNEYNDYGIGICLVGNFEDKLPSRGQLASLVRLVRFLMVRYHIGPGRVIGHQQAPNAITKCPGEKLQNYLQGEFLTQIQD